MLLLLFKTVVAGNILIAITDASSHLPFVTTKLLAFA